MKHIVGIDIGGSAIKGGYFDGDQLKGTNRVPTFAFKGASTVYRQIFSCVNGLLNSYGEIDAIGVVSAGDMGEDGTFVKVNNIRDEREKKAGRRFPLPRGYRKRCSGRLGR